MSLLAILISLALEKSLPALNRLRSLAWFAHYQGWIRSQCSKHSKWRGTLSLLLIVLLPVIGVAVIQYFLDDLLSLFSFVFSIIVLIYCLGPEDEHRRVSDYLDAIEDENRSDQDNIQDALSGILQAGGISDSEISEDETTRSNQLINSVLVITHDRMLAILFWFVVLGPMGAVLYRLTLALAQSGEQQDFQQASQAVINEAEDQTTNSANSDNDHSEPAIHSGEDSNDDTDTDTDDNNDDCNERFNKAVKRLHGLLSWIPSHLTALSYAVMGSFVHALPAWKNKRKNDAAAHSQNDEKRRKSTFNGTSNSAPINHDLLIRIGRASLQFDQKPPQDNKAVRETLGLCGRSLVAWVTILAIMTLAGWAS